MCKRKGSIGLVLFCGLLMALCWQMPARAASAPPTIDQIVGTYSVKDAETWYDFDVGLPGKTKYDLTWHITKISDSPPRVQVQITGDWNWTFTACYKNGFLVQSSGNVSSGTAFWGALGIGIFSGSPGKIKFKGNFGYGQFGSGWNGDEYWEWDPYSGKMTSTNPGYVGSTLASQDDERAVSVPGEGEVPLAIGSTLTVDDLPGTYSCTLTSTLYSLSAGTTEKEPKQSNIVTITKIDDQTLNLNTSGGDIYTHYGAGVLMLANVDNDTLDPDALLGLLLAKGKPGKISLKGKILKSQGLETPDDEFEAATVTCKQTMP